LKQLNQLRGGTSAASAATVAAPSTHAAPAPRPAPKAPIASQETIAAPAASAAAAEPVPISSDLATVWTQLIEAVGRVSPFTRSYLVDANPVSFVKNVLVIGFDRNLKITSASWTTRGTIRCCKPSWPSLATRTAR